MDSRGEQCAPSHRGMKQNAVRSPGWQEGRMPGVGGGGVSERARAPGALEMSAVTDS